MVASRVGEKDKAYELYQWTARLDLDDANHDTSEGLHITSMSGAWLAITQGFAGMTTMLGDLRFAPYLPNQLEKYAFKIHYRDRLVKIDVSQSGVEISKLFGENITLCVYDEWIDLSNRVTIPLSK